MSKKTTPAKSAAKPDAKKLKAKDLAPDVRKAVKGGLSEESAKFSRESHRK